MTKKWLFFVFFSSVMLTGCETIHTGILGDIPTGGKPLGALNVGDIYNDPKGRFSLRVMDSRNLVAHRTPEGVVLEGKDIDRGDILYGALVYEIPSYVTGTDRDVLKATWNGLIAKAQTMNGNLYAIDIRESVCQDLPCLIVHYRSETNEGYVRRGYISRFVKSKSRVYNFYFSYASVYQGAFDKAIYGSLDSYQNLEKPAEDFFASASFK